MGKLHTLRRAIKSNPQAFMSREPLFASVGLAAWRSAAAPRYCAGAEFRGGRWQPVVVSSNSVPFPYRRFVQRTLRSLGYDVSM